MTDIDPVEFGELRSQVNLLEKQVMELQKDVKTLLELANKSKGGFWMGMAIASMLGGIISWMVAHLQFRPPV